MQGNIPAVLAIIKHIYNTILYAELNTKLDLCEVCGYNGEIQIVNKNGKLIWRCPQCGCTDQNKMHVTRRTCGYLGTQYWNQGRTQEIAERVLHVSIDEDEAEKKPVKILPKSVVAQIKWCRRKPASFLYAENFCILKIQKKSRKEEKL